MDAIRIIHEEHRSLSAVLHGMLYLVRDIRFAFVRPNFDVLTAMTSYVDAFSERCHHPKEDKYLFRLLRLRHPGAAALLQRLEQEHRIGAEKIRTLEQMLTGYRQRGASEFPAFAAAASGFAAFHYAHMREEETLILPLAKLHLTAGDWDEIDAAFAGNTDPLVGVSESVKYKELFRRIVELAPPPLGVGSRR